jgi:predicted DNA-binding transcriptional regulator
MNLIWGLILGTVGLLFLIWGLRKSDFVIYQLLVARSRMLWGEQVHRFYQIVGIALIVIGLLWGFGFIWKG